MKQAVKLFSQNSSFLLVLGLAPAIEPDLMRA